MLLQWYFNTNGGLGRRARFLLVQPRTQNFCYSHDGIYGLLWENPLSSRVNKKIADKCMLTDPHKIWDT